MKNKLTPEDLDQLIADHQYIHVPGSTLTLCVLRLTNGSTVTGESNVIDPKNFNVEIGRSVAFRNAKDKIWGLEGYALKRDITLVVERAAKAAHEANREYCRNIGDLSHLSWEDAPKWQRDSAMDGVRQIMKNPDCTPKQSHENWLEHKKENGWVHGPVKDAETKEHPCMVPYEALPDAQKIKDVIFGSVVRAFLL